MKSTDAHATRQVRQFQQARAAVAQLQARYSTLQTVSAPPCNKAASPPVNS
ncbi:hypothetical protein [Sodalis glossinidius]|uniref:hypothetical protein n=1 Tax=Sodalis glossinidius TaxID=63612 RepID=UPI0013052A54|nr:hypothetical protein [Sodalis glossinidius]